MQLTLFRDSEVAGAEVAGTAIEREFYPTPYELAHFAMSRLWRPQQERLIVLDAGAGAGVWGQALKSHAPGATLVGVDLKGVPQADGYDHWLSGDFLRIAERMRERRITFHGAIGNPPFSLAESFVRATFPLLKPGAPLILLLRQGFGAGQARCRDFWPKYPLRARSDSARRPSFTGNGVTDTYDYSIFVWKKGWSGFGTLLPSFDYLFPATQDWTEDFEL